MKDTNFSDTEIQKMLSVVAAGLNRFFLDGPPTWSKTDFEKLFKISIDLNDERIQAKLFEWQHKGYVQYVDTDELYIKTLKPIE